MVKQRMDVEELHAMTQERGIYEDLVQPNGLATDAGGDRATSDPASLPKHVY